MRAMPLFLFSSSRDTEATNPSVPETGAGTSGGVVSLSSKAGGSSGILPSSGLRVGPWLPSRTGASNSATQLDSNWEHVHGLHPHLVVA